MILQTALPNNYQVLHTQRTQLCVSHCPRVHVLLTRLPRRQRERQGVAFDRQSIQQQLLSHSHRVYCRNHQDTQEIIYIHTQREGRSNRCTNDKEPAERQRHRESALRETMSVVVLCPVCGSQRTRKNCARKASLSNTRSLPRERERASVRRSESSRERRGPTARDTHREIER